MERPWPRTRTNIKSGVPALATRESGPMSHHRPCETSATAARSRLVQLENHAAGRSCSYRHALPPSRLARLLSFVVLLAIWTSLLGAASAHQEPKADRRKLGARSASLPLPFDDLAPVWKGPSLLVVDTSPPPAAPLMHLFRRQDEEEATSTTPAAASGTSIETDPAATSTDFSIPQPFDTALSNNFTASCAAFFRRLLTDEPFKQCHPFSLMLQTSSAFFDASKSFVRITQTLEATCGANLTSCSNTMNFFARELIAGNNCAVDYGNDNPQVLQAYNGLIAYEPLYQASCLRDDDGSYCYANAVTNTTATGDPYPFYLPLGVPLFGGARPTCNTCLQNEMAIFSSFAGNTTQPISKTYNAAAQQIQISCGTGFVNQTATPLKGAASATSASLTPTITLFVMLFICFFQ